MRVTPRLKTLFSLSAPAETVELDLLRIRRGYELPVRRLAARRAMRAPTVCRAPTRRNKREAKAYVIRTNWKRFQDLSREERKRFIRKQLGELRCTHLATVFELEVKGIEGTNQVALATGKGLPRGRYRVAALALNSAGAHSAPKSVDFLVGRDGRKVTTGTKGSRR